MVPGMTTVEVRAYDPAWPALAAAAITEVRAALTGVPIEIEHIGSTAVPGLAAKPIIDLMLAAPGLDDVSGRAGRLAAIGFHPEPQDMPARLLYVREAAGRRTHHLHVVTALSWPARNQRLLRDWLRAHPDDVARYADLKRALAAGGLSADDYTRAKTGLIQELTDRARAERGLPPAPVWEA
jgi:GrpB-like predicted nucleotidyltransferase (UPF0157 family)